jgi:hypothetical protein
MPTPTAPPVTRSSLTAVILGVALLAAGICAALAFSVYSDPELSFDFSGPDGALRLVAVLSPVLAGLIPALTAMALGRTAAIGWPWLIGAGGVLGALLLGIPLAVGLIQQAGAQTLTAATMLVSFFSFGMGMAAGIAALIALWIESTIKTRRRRARRLRVIFAIERQLQGTDLTTATAVEIGPTAYAELIADWGVDAEGVVVRRRDGEVIALSSARWPAPRDEPIVELPIQRSGPDHGVRVIWAATPAPADP